MELLESDSGSETDGSSSHCSVVLPAGDLEDVGPPLVAIPAVEGEAATGDPFVLPDKEWVALGWCPFSGKWWLSHSISSEKVPMDCANAGEPALHDDGEGFMIVQQPISDEIEDYLDHWCHDMLSMNVYAIPGQAGQFMGFDSSVAPDRFGDTGHTLYLPLEEVVARADPCQVLWSGGSPPHEIKFSAYRMQCHYQGCRYLWKAIDIHATGHLAAGGNRAHSTWVHKRKANMRKFLKEVQLPEIVESMPYCNSARAKGITVNAPSLATPVPRCAHKINCNTNRMCDITECLI